MKCYHSFLETADGELITVGDSGVQPAGHQPEPPAVAEGSIVDESNTTSALPDPVDGEVFSKMFSLNLPLLLKQSRSGLLHYTKLKPDIRLDLTS